MQRAVLVLVPDDRRTPKRMRSATALTSPLSSGMAWIVVAIFPASRMYSAIGMNRSLSW